MNGFAAGDGFTTDQTLPDLDRGNSTYDVRHRLTVSYLWELPFFLHRKGFSARRWQAGSSTASGHQSGAHWTAFDPRRFVDFQELAAGACEARSFDPWQCVSEGGDYNLDGVSNDRPNALKDHANATHTQWPTASTFPQIFSLRPAWHASATWAKHVAGPGYWAGDVSVFKSFKLAEQLRLQFRAGLSMR